MYLAGVPTYGYRCPKGHEFEAIHGIGGPPPTACEICGATPVSRVFYPISISFTGKGFYTTDYGRGDQKPEAPVSSRNGVKTSDDGTRKTDETTTKKSPLELRPSPAGNLTRPDSWEHMWEHRVSMSDISGTPDPQNQAKSAQAGIQKYPQRDSNPCCRRERPES
jgi:putative FmdB family regulatory protein